MALGWSKCSVELNLNAANMDTYASLFFKLGRNAEAEMAEEKALDLAKKERSDTSSIEELLAKIIEAQEKEE